MYKTKIYLHIGMPKSASTTIQEGLILNRDRLLKSGWLFPESGFIHSGHHNFVWELRKDKRFSPGIGGTKDLLKEIDNSGKKKIIISSENFFVFSNKEIKKLKKILSKFEMKLIIYLRRQDKWLQSLWTHRINKGYAVFNFENWIERKLNPKERKSRANGDYFAIINDWIKVFGKESFNIRILEESQLKEPVFIDFIKFCGIENHEKFSLPKDANISPSIKTLEVIRNFKIHLRKYKMPEESQRLYSKFILQYAIHHGWNQERPQLINKKLYHLIDKRFQKSNQKIANKYFDRDKLFMDEFDEKPVTSFALTDLKRREFFDIFGFVAARIEQERNN